MTDTLMVGVSGIRGIVGKDLTPENVARYAAAFGVWAIDGKRETRKGKRRSRAVVLGRDARTSGPMFAHAAIAGLVSVGCDVIDIGLTTTPTAQLAALHHRAAGGIILTASHNPIEWNALKFIGPDGIFLDTDAGARVQVLASDGSLPRADYGKLGQVTPDNSSIPRHVAQVLRLPAVAIARLRRRRFRVALDTVRGSGGAVMPELLTRLGWRVTGINLGAGGRVPRAPEPLPQHPAAVGGLVARAMQAHRAPIGGEGNGGVMYPALHVGRDAPVAAALVLTLLARDGRPVSALVGAAPRYQIVKAKVERGTRNADGRLAAVYAALRRRFRDATVDTQDGLRLTWRDRWLHVRPSNTEPIIRLIAEAPSGTAAGQLVGEGRKLCAAS